MFGRIQSKVRNWTQITFFFVRASADIRNIVADFRGFPDNCLTINFITQGTMFGIAEALWNIYYPTCSIRNVRK